MVNPKDKRLIAKHIIESFGEWWHYPEKIEQNIVKLLDKGLSADEAKEILGGIISDVRNEYGD